MSSIIVVDGSISSTDSGSGGGRANNSQAGSALADVIQLAAGPNRSKCSRLGGKFPNGSSNVLGLRDIF